MRQSFVSLAVIASSGSGTTRFLARWNEKKDAYILPGGHKCDGESYRACLVRRLAEVDELGLFPPADDPEAKVVIPPAAIGSHLFVRVAPQPLGRHEYQAFSRSGGERTQYAIEFFTAELSSEALKVVAVHQGLRWLSEAEIEAGVAEDGRPVSDTLRHHIAWVRLHEVPVSWALAAIQRTREAMAEVLASSADESSFDLECVFVARMLRQIFPDAKALVIRQRFEGFRRRVRPHKLLVEVARSRGVFAPGVFGCREVYVVKIGRPTEADEAEALEDELRGWRRCDPGGSDTILSRLNGVVDPTNGRLIGLVYRDATTALGGLTSNLEDAIRDCCRFGMPSLHAICGCLRQLYNRLDLRLYRQSFNPTPTAHLEVAAPDTHPVRRDDISAKQSPTLLRARVVDALERMNETIDLPDLEERRRLRREALARLAMRENPVFLDPYDYLQGVLDNCNPIPQMLVGVSHGDLHGRNVLVSRFLNDVSSPAVFDYGDMHPANHIGWDFAKMETEVKVRIYPYVFSRRPQTFVKEVRQFEEQLAKRTENLHHRLANRRDSPEKKKPLERLAQVLLEIRLQARRYLGSERHRVDRWLEEYYFLLACCGCNASRFPTYDHHEWLGAYVSAGSAASRLSHPWRNLSLQIRQAQQDARDRLKTAPHESDKLVAAAKQAACFAQVTINHHAPLEFARIWIEANVRSQRSFVEAGVTLLGELQQKFPHVLEITEVHLLGLLELGLENKAMTILQTVQRRHVELADEMEARLGRIFKVHGENLWLNENEPMPQQAREQFERGLAMYRRAWNLSRNYYSGINVAALLRLLAQSETDIEEAQRVAAEVLTETQRHPETDLWALITQADAQVLLGEHVLAEQIYRRARPHCTAHNLRSALRQLKLLLRNLDLEGRKHWTKSHMSDVFGQEAVNEVYPPSSPGQGPPLGMS